MSKILIIDDEKELVMLLQDELEARGHNILVAFNGVEGIELAKKQPDLIILDIMMPKTDGFEVCRKIRDDVLCPIIFLSAKQAESDKIRALTLGGDDYITKPFGLRELLARIDANLRREQRSQYINVENKRKKLYFSKLSIDLFEHTVKISETTILLSKRNTILLNCLRSMQDRFFPKNTYTKKFGDMILTVTLIQS